MTIPIETLIKVPIIYDFDTDKECKTILYSSNETGKLQLYLSATDMSTPPKMITNSEESILGGYLSPDGNYIVYPLDKGGNEISDLYAISPEGGKSKKITPQAYRTMGITWHPNSKELSRSIITSQGSGIETINVETGETFILANKIPILFDIHYSHDGNWLACTAIKSFINTEVLIVNREDPTERIEYSLTDQSKEGIVSWSPNDKKLAFGSEAPGKALIVIQEFQGDEQIILQLEDEEEVPISGGSAAWHPNNDLVYYPVSKHSRTIIHAHPINGDKGLALPFPEGTVIKPCLSNNGKRMLALHSSMISPPGIYLHELGTENVTPVTPREFGFDLSFLQKPSSIWYDTFDGRKIHGWYTPAKSDKISYPAIVHPHGGPWAQTFDNWVFGLFDQVLSQSGFGMLSPNYRGSTGYGTEFQKLDIGDAGGGDLEDIDYAAAWLRKQPKIDPNKIAITGASYGGYMTLIALTKKPDTFVAGAARVPVVDWLKMYKLADPFFQQFQISLFEGKPRKEKKQLYIDRSPITHVANIKAPVMISAGKSDSRCPIEPIEDFIEKLKEMDHTYEFILLEESGHISSFFDWEESIPIFTRTVEFFKNYLV